MLSVDINVDIKLDSTFNLTNSFRSSFQSHLSVSESEQNVEQIFNSRYKLIKKLSSHVAANVYLVSDLLENNTKYIKYTLLYIIAI